MDTTGDPGRVDLARTVTPKRKQLQQMKHTADSRFPVNGLDISGQTDP